MAPLELNFLEQLHEDYTKFTNFIESGTYKGATIFNMEPYFKKLHTIEIKPELHSFCKSKYDGNKIDFYLGDSSEMLKSLLQTIEGSSIIFLDGHYSAGDTGKGKKDCPLYEELDQIMRCHVDNAIVIVDDVRMFGRGPRSGTDICDWEDISMEGVLKFVEKRAFKHYFLEGNITPDYQRMNPGAPENDRLIIHIKALE